MEKQRWSPTAVVGVDFGMTCTGAAYSSEDSGWARPEVILKWPDGKNALFNKFPSRVGYNKAGQAVDFGRCNLAPDVYSQEREFKLYLDSSFCEKGKEDPAHQNAIKCYIDYMKKLHQHLNYILAQRLPRWDERDAEFRFSVPTTWKSPRLIAQLKMWLEEAGFVNSLHRRMIFSRTEAEAAAIYVAKNYQKGDVIMVVDAGGATTDLNILEVTEQNGDITQMRALDKAEGIDIGSVMIDREARAIIEQKLQDLHVHSEIGLKWVAESMMEKSGFEYFKCNFNDDNSRLDHYMDVPNRSGQRVKIRAEELENIFEHLVRELADSVNDKITSLARSHPRHWVRYIVLSGGLGSSKFVKERLTAETGRARLNASSRTHPHIVVAAEPQLAVVKGLVIDRAQALDHGVVAYVGRCSRVSYGVLCKVPYDQKIHFGEPSVKDPLSGNIWVEDQIDWIIKEGEVVPEEGVLRPYTLKITPDKRLEPFKAHIVMSELPAAALPRSLPRGPVTRLCTVEGNFQLSDFLNGDVRKIRKGLFSSRKEHEVAYVQLKVIVGSTDLGFELVSLDGRKFSEGTEKINVVWHDFQPRVRRVDEYSKVYGGHLANE